MAFSLPGEPVSFLKGEGPGRRHRIPEKFPREARRPSHSLGSLGCSRCPQSGASGRNVRGLRPLLEAPAPAPRLGGVLPPRPRGPDPGPWPLHLQLRLPKPPRADSRCADRPGWACGWERRCAPRRPRARNGGGAPADTWQEPNVPIAHSSAAPPPRERAKQELAEVCQILAEVSGKLQLPLGASRLAHGDRGWEAGCGRESCGGRAYRVPAPVRTGLG